MEREKVSLGEIAQVHDFEIISLGGGRPHMDLPEYRAAAQRLEAVQEQVAAAEQDIATLEKQRKALQGNVKLLKAVEKVKPDLDAIQPEKTLTGAVKGVTVEQVKELKAAAIRGAAAEQKVQELKEENQRLQQKIPSTKEKLKEAQERQRLENQNRKLLVQVECLEQELEQERSFSDRLLDGVSAVMDFLDRHLPEKFRPLSKGPGSCCLCRRCSSQSRSRNEVIPGAAWSFDKIGKNCIDNICLSRGLESAIWTGYNNNKK